MCFIKEPLPVASRKFCVFFKFGSLTIWNLLIKCRSERKFFPDPHCLFQTLKLCNRIHNSCFRHSTKKNRLTDGLDSHLLIDFLRTGSGQKEKTEQFRIRIRVCERKERGVYPDPDPKFFVFLFYRILFAEFDIRVDCFAFSLIRYRYGLKKKPKRLHRIFLYPFGNFNLSMKPEKTEYHVFVNFLFRDFFLRQ